MKMLFKFEYDDTYVNGPCVETKGTSHFKKGGYENNDVGKAVMLNIGDSILVDGGHQKITRVK